MANRVGRKLSAEKPGSKIGEAMRLLDFAIPITSMAASFAFFAALVGLLSAFDGKAIFGYRVVTLNTLVAILSAANKATVIYAVSHSNGRRKWINFSSSRPRRLLGFDRIESASRGPLGSSWRPLWQALLTVLAIANDPFAQQLV
ncbi:hypothetical protein B0T26DRAFT_803384 [Lasiosphaeria miniovina]|uniref:Uncharacterized protein n=1 Tax=Lasiosphaeria miniovina TaxID=1954250 RepID=A0AA40AMG8_9PEZI|nr:uncharacterized protein B0T26DRAFT_803384 [Lasiosphaeria miniovina]KAK0718570.1 hypothetical protein B0T26DRAFT_803384 [Lasiosphaeria miniovina]